MRGASGLPSQSRLPPCQLSRRESQVCAPPKVCRKLSLASPLGRGGLALARTERASCQPHRPLPWLSPLRARPPRSLVSFWLTPTKVKTVGRCPTPCKLFEKSLSKNFNLAPLGFRRCCLPAYRWQRLSANCSRRCRRRRPAAPRPRTSPPPAWTPWSWGKSPAGSPRRW